MIKATVKTYQTNRRRIRETALASPELMRNAVLLTVRRERQEIRKDVSIAVPKPAHPFIWSNVKKKQDKARRFWFWAVRTGRIKTDGKRYVRTGETIKGWELISNIRDWDGLITIRNKAPRRQFVVGKRQVPSHRLSGHPHIDRVVIRSQKRMNPKLRALWQTISNPESATRRRVYV